MFNRLLVVIFITVLLTFCMCSCISAETAENVAYAPGLGMIPPVEAQLWDSDSFTEVGTFTMEGNNLTPVKKIGAQFDYVVLKVDNFTCEKNVKLTVQVLQAYTDRILASNDFPASSSGSDLTTCCKTEKGDYFQIFFRVTDENGNYDDNLKCEITYSYKLSNNPE